MKILMGWKEIAGVLRVSERTLRENWKLWGIPLKFLPSRKGYRKPVIFLTELERWLKELEDERS